VFVRTDEDYEETKVLHDKIEQSIIHHIGRIAKPDMIIFVTELPKTVSGKIMRRLLREIVATGAVSGDITGLENPSVIEHLKNIVQDRKSTRLNSSHVSISYAVFCLKKIRAEENRVRI